MENLEQKLSDVLSITLGRETRSANTVIEHSVPIPVDLLIDIFSRVPAKSIARFRCLSKLWESMLRRSYFDELFLTNSLSRPRLLLFVLRFKGEDVFFCSPQPRNLHDNLSLVATRYPKCYFRKHFPYDISPSLYGLVLLKDVVLNPVTRDSLTLPKVKGQGGKSSYLCYVPINKQFKVLCIEKWPNAEVHYTFQVLTLQTGKPTWRKIEYNLEWYFGDYGQIVCINGFLYAPNKIQGCYVLICFDTMLEEFSIVRMDDEMLEMNRFWHLFNYKGKLVVHKLNYLQDEIMLWVREDAEKHNWSKCICMQPPLWDEGFFSHYEIVGMIDTGEIVFSRFCLSNTFPVIVYYNVERKTFSRVHIQGFEEFTRRLEKKEEFTQELPGPGFYIHLDLDYVENIKFL